MAKIGPYQVSEEKLSDILAGRARLEAWRQSFQPYPYYEPDDTHPKNAVPHEVVPALSYAMINDLQNRLNKHIDSTTKKGGKSKYD